MDMSRNGAAPGGSRVPPGDAHKLCENARPVNPSAAERSGPIHRHHFSYAAETSSAAQLFSL